MTHKSEPVALGILSRHSLISAAFVQVAAASCGTKHRIATAAHSLPFLGDDHKVSRNCAFLDMPAGFEAILGGSLRYTRVKNLVL